MNLSKFPFSGKFQFSTCIAALFVAAFSLRAQTLPCPDTNDVVKFLMPPQVDGGLDVRDSGPDNIVLADDFFCNTPGPITDIHLWGSWNFDAHGTITNFWLGIFDDVPAVTNLPTGQVTPSHPGTNLLWQQSFGPGQFSENPYAPGSEGFYNPPTASLLGSDSMAWYYCFTPSNPFVQKGTAQNPTNYWLAVYASVDLPAGSQGPYGWKTSLSNYNDAAVWGHFVATTGNPIGDWKPLTNSQTLRPIDLSFKLDTTNAPPPTCNESNGVKYIQPPNFQGLDVWNSGPWVLADDFVCTNTGPVSDIHLWGSWAQDHQPDTNISFWLAVYDDVPASATNLFSIPGNLLWNEQFPPGQYVQTFAGTGREAFLDPGPPNILGPESNVWYYCFTPTNLTQYGSLTNPQVYWLMVYATLPSGSTNMYGWKTTTVISNDISVHAQWGGSPPIGNPGWTRTFQASTGGPLDLAFKLTTVTNNSPPPVPCQDTNDVVKYIQPPQLFNGYDVWNSSAFPPGVTDGPWVLADDFVCTNPGPITDIHIWGSWLNNAIATNSITFWVAMFSNVPANPPTMPYSQPGVMFWEQCFPPGQYVETPYATGQENFLDPGPPSIIGPDSEVLAYCFMPSNPPVQSGTTAFPQTYWLAVYAQQQPATSGNNFFGWKTTTNVQNDISVHTQWTAPFCPTNLAGTALPWTPTRDTNGVPLDLSFALTTQTNPCPGTPPTLYCSNMVVECGTNWSPIPPGVSDPCCPTAPTPVLISSITNTTTVCPQYITNIWQVTDCQNLSATCEQTITVQDTTPPYFTFCPTNFTVQCGTSWFFGTAVATDNCCLKSVNTVSTITNGTPCSQMITRTWEAIDCCGNSNICSQSVMVVATNPPIMSCATNKTVMNGSTWNFDPPTATDACSGANLPVTVVGTVTNGTSPCNETFTRTWQAVDACNNTNFCSQTVTNVCPPVFCVESDWEKYVQGPNIFGGFDVWNTPYVLADDFICTNRGPVSDIHLWGSWRSDNPLTNTINFWLGIYNDVPAMTNLQGVVTPSHPGTNLMWQQWFYPGQYAETIWTSNAQEQFLDPGNSNVIGPDSVVWYYCFYPTNAFQQLGTPTNHITYWLAAYAQLPVGINQVYGWKTTTNVMNDTSVHAIWPGMPPIANPGWTPTAVLPLVGGPAVPLDLAFKITSCGGGGVTISNLLPTNVVVTWMGSGHLQSATNVVGPYTDVPGSPTSPYIDYSRSPTNKFYRLRCYP
jgi:hypothetical protein